jgi:hypothetical protein
MGERDARDQRVLAEVLGRPLDWAAQPDALDPQELYFATMVAFEDESAWPRWSEDVGALILARAALAGCAEGSYAAVDPWSRIIGRVGTNAEMVLALRNSYRYRVIFR